MDLVINNALLYNKSDSAVYRAASRLKKSAPSLCAVLDNERMLVPRTLSNGVNHSSLVRDIRTKIAAQPNGISVSKSAMDVDEAPKVDLMIGDLEPPLAILELLICISAIKSDLPIDLQDEPLQSLLNYELAIPKPLPTPPPLPSSKTRRKRDRKAEYERAKAKKAAAAAEAMATAAEALTLLNGGHHPVHTHPSVNQLRIIDEEVSLQSLPLQSAPLVPAPSLHPVLSPLPPALSLLSSASTFLDITTSSSPPPPLLSPLARSIAYGPQGFVNTSFEDRLAAISTSPSVIEAPRDLEISSETSPTSPKLGRPPRRKRTSLSLPGRTEIPPVVLDVDNRDSFKMFDGGWILPPDQRRGGRMPVDRSLQPPPRKRARIGTSLFNWHP